MEGRFVGVNGLSEKWLFNFAFTWITSERGGARGKPSTAATSFARSCLPRSLLSANVVAASVWFAGVRGLSEKWLSNFLLFVDAHILVIPLSF